MRRLHRYLLVSLTCVAIGSETPTTAQSDARLPGDTWKRHVIDDTSEGADGTRLQDVDGDGLLDIVTAWEEGGVVRAYRNPGPEYVRSRWPQVTVGKVGSPEDAVFCDLDGSGRQDVVSSCEGRERSLFFHWAPDAPEDYWRPEAWTTTAVPVSKGIRWMFALPMQIDGKHGVDVVAGAKDAGAQVGVLVSPPDPLRVEDWRWHPLYDAGWIMSLVAEDMNGNGLQDILVSDRKGDTPGIFWLENPGPQTAATQPWKIRRIGADGLEVMFLDVVDVDQDGLADVVAAVKKHGLIWLRRLDESGVKWESRRIPFPEGVGTPKAVSGGDVTGDGKIELIVSCEHSSDLKSGVFGLKTASPLDGRWQAFDISGPDGVKFDVVVLVDLDGDGDLDVLTCEENADLGVIWYENPGNER